MGPGLGSRPGVCVGATRACPLREGGSPGGLWVEEGGSDNFDGISLAAMWGTDLGEAVEITHVNPWQVLTAVASFSSWSLSSSAPQLPPIN